MATNDSTRADESIHRTNQTPSEPLLDIDDVPAEGPPTGLGTATEGADAVPSQTAVTDAAAASQRKVEVEQQIDVIRSRMAAYPSEPVRALPLQSAPLPPLPPTERRPAAAAPTTEPAAVGGVVPPDFDHPTTLTPDQKDTIAVEEFAKRGLTAQNGTIDQMIDLVSSAIYPHTMTETKAAKAAELPVQAASKPRTNEDLGDRAAHDIEAKIATTSEQPSATEPVGQSASPGPAVEQVVE